MSDPRPRHRRLLWRLGLAVAGSFAFAFALVPLYDVFCDITGLNGKTDSRPAARAAVAVPEQRRVTVQFLANVNADAPWRFAPEARQMEVHPGEYYRTSYRAENLTPRAMAGQAVPSVAPGEAAQYLQKVECFCFQQQAFEAREARDMPVVFRLDPELPAEISTLTLSYTFFELPEAGAAPAGG